MRLPFAVNVQSDSGDGYIVTVGCHIFAYTDPLKLVKDFAAYIEDPEKVIAERLQVPEPPSPGLPTAAGPPSYAGGSAQIAGQDRRVYGRIR